MRVATFFVLCVIMVTVVSVCKGQDKGQFSGQVQMSANAFLEDAEIGATGTPQYDDEIFGGELWLELSYQIKGFDFGIRGDVFINSNLLNPRGSYTDYGVGRWYVRKQLGDFHLEAGYFYDQIGSGLIFRSYEQRPLLIDNAVLGGLIKYDLTDNWQVKAFMGKQKNLFDLYSSIIRGASVDGFVSLGEESNISIVPGIGILNRRWSDEQVDEIIQTLQNYTPSDSIGFFYNTYAYTIYNTLSVGPVSWYAEAAFKVRDIYYDADASRLLYTGETTLGKFRNENGSVLYSTVSGGFKGVGFTVEYKRTENFSYRADPFAALNRGLINFLPPMVQVNTYRLKSRYIPATRELSEQAWQAELRYGLGRKWDIVHYFSTISSLEGELLYRELDNEVSFRHSRYFQGVIGFQMQRYDQAIYEGKTGVPPVRTFIPYVELLKKFPNRHSVRMEAQYMYTQQDFGSWLFVLMEYNMAPTWSFSISDMYNIDPLKTDNLHYPRMSVNYVNQALRISLSYIKQVEGVVCAGGICRLEPAFSGVRLAMSTTF